MVEGTYGNLSLSWLIPILQVKYAFRLTVALHLKNGLLIYSNEAAVLVVQHEGFVQEGVIWFNLCGTNS